MTTPKRIVIEATAMGYVPCGVREYTRQLCPRIISRRPDEFQLSFIVPPGFAGCFGTATGVDYLEAGAIKIDVLKYTRFLKADLFHAMHQLCKVWKIPAARRTLLTVHDINFLHTRTGAKLRRATRRFEKRLDTATDLCFISRFVEKDVREHFPTDLPARVIYNGVTPPDPSSGVRPTAAPDGKFLYHLSSLERYKNPHLLIEMMDYLPDRTLVMAGVRCSDYEAMASGRKNVVLLGRVSDEENVWLYDNCEAFLFPSKAEGFGLPPIEAMHLGKPVFLSDLTSLPEVGGRAAHYWHNLEPKKMAEIVESGLQEENNAEAIIRQASRFSWDACAEAYVQYYKDILSEA